MTPPAPLSASTDLAAFGTLRAVINLGGLVALTTVESAPDLQRHVGARPGIGADDGSVR